MREYEIQEIKSASVQDSLALLSEVADYLRRLPPVPATYHLLNKVESFVESPNNQTANRLSLEDSYEKELRKNIRSGGDYCPSGLTIIEVEVQGDDIFLKMPNHCVWRMLVSKLKKGLQLRLTTLKKC
jgi:hypothetical protein